eukprot:s1132_g5.t1
MGIASYSDSSRRVSFACFRACGSWSRQKTSNGVRETFVATLALRLKRNGPENATYLFLLSFCKLTAFPLAKLSWAAHHFAEHSRHLN